LTALETLLAAGAVPRRHAERAVRHVLSQLVCLGSHTISGLLNASGRQFWAWGRTKPIYCNTTT